MLLSRFNCSSVAFFIALQCSLCAFGLPGCGARISRMPVRFKLMILLLGGLIVFLAAVVAKPVAVSRFKERCSAFKAQACAQDFGLLRGGGLAAVIAGRRLVACAVFGFHRFMLLIAPFSLIHHSARSCSARVE